MFSLGSKKYLPLYEGKMIHQFEHRAASMVLSQTAAIRQGQPESLSAKEHADPTRVPIPCYWVSDAEAVSRTDEKSTAFLGFTDVTSPTNERTVIAAIVPPYGAGHSMPLMVGRPRGIDLLLLVANLNSFAFDFVARQKVGGVHLTFFILSQLAILPPAAYEQVCPWYGSQTIGEWIAVRALELTYTSWDLKDFATECGYTGPPFGWDEEKRLELRCELDAAFFRLYWIEPGDVSRIMDKFPIVKRKDEAKLLTYRTREQIVSALERLPASSSATQPTAVSDWTLASQAGA